MFLVDLDETEAPSHGTTLSFSRATTVLLTFAANRFTRKAAQHYRKQFGIGVMDWRMLVMLTRAPGCNVAHASKTMGIDKAAVSRSLARLENSGLAASTVNTPDERRRDWRLTKRGHDLHDRILKASLKQQKALLEGFTPLEVEQFNGFLRCCLKNLDSAS
ncbi:MarR family winged helix-turn-helix transcriptional regulator [Roseibium sp. Sym1]|uniref:MarR family winged helix-turn-helix transcriptional regulator n=1 Tax=Roseibium sp. Sym1 TaxID=3016006 RepID=UPI0022B3B4B5|nr:MarR family transcriptional regulator [Roseibium sp. Sym1]